MQALLANIVAAAGPHPDLEVRREACTGLQPWWQWYALELSSQRVQSDMVWFVLAVVGAIEVMRLHSDEDPHGALEAGTLAGMMLECDEVKQDDVTRARLESAWNGAACV